MRVRETGAAPTEKMDLSGHSHSWRRHLLPAWFAFWEEITTPAGILAFLTSLLLEALGTSAAPGEQAETNSPGNAHLQLLETPENTPQSFSAGRH